MVPTKDQGGAKTFQDGLGVNMRGDLAVQSNVYYVPKMEDVGRELVDMGASAHRADTGVSSDVCSSYASFMQGVSEMEKRGEKVYYIKRRPGIPLAGGTVWTFDWNGELRQECIVVAGDLINGVQMDEDRAIYFVNARPRLFGEKLFLQGQGGTLGTSDEMVTSNYPNRNPFTGTLVKTKPDRQCDVLLSNAPVPLTPLPSRPPDVYAADYMQGPFGKGGYCWVEGAEWLYAGAAPMIAAGCTCPSQRLHVDWYKRVFVPEAYRHSFGVLDAAGNLIMHLGRYGNFDDAPGGKNGAKPGGADIAMFNPRFISGTDNYLAFEDLAEKLVVLKLNYHAEETVEIQVK
jgi:hypothetical protein